MAHKIEKLRIGLRAVFYEEGGYWVAHCLEMDVMGHDRKKDAAFIKMLNAIGLQIANSIEAGTHANIFMPADARFFEMFSAGRDIVEGTCIVTQEVEKVVRMRDDIDVQGIETREYRGSLAMA